MDRGRGQTDQGGKPPERRGPAAHPKKQKLLLGVPIAWDPGEERGSIAQIGAAQEPRITQLGLL